MKLENKKDIMRIIHHDQLLKPIEFKPIIERIERGFSLYSMGKAKLSPVSHLHFDSPPGDLHVKCAHVIGEQFYVVKAASHFTENNQKGLNSIQGMMILFCQKTGIPQALFLDNGYLTNLRTAMAGTICAKYMAPKNIEAIGIIGAGMQAKMQLKMLKSVTTCRQVWVWAPRSEAIEQYKKDPMLADFTINAASSTAEIAEHCRLIVTTTPACNPLLFAHDIKKGTHITAIGSDRPGKQELDAKILQMADRVIVDSREQCFNYGETFYALQKGLIDKEKVDEIGEVISGLKNGRLNEDEVTVADLTGLGIQDLDVATAFYELL